MNRVYKIVWSKAKNAYVVTSELAKNHTKSASGKAVKAALTAAVGMGVLMGGYAADAAAKDIVDKGGSPIAYDISPENDGTNIAIGKNAKVFIGGGAADRLLASVGRPDLFMEMCVSYLAASEMLSIVENLNDAGVGVLSGLVRKLKRK